ncbi:hypothetical protein RFI_30813 [Reticulomyxa filosa]|uniref:Gfo/Idh/MocA-like oxidoreductase N-terminal domain-containing protein n=1 Tax=Reticulomyxa filosa TaxID=46433 RepID=X6LXA4_RETFI|nr:hypothetical protein RFI_30813 [Reticulomyxa filosa]|eukprot:ETO06578.1 hypothetical protein RFI_30813 [Reticulomyxa filosa]
MSNKNTFSLKIKSHCKLKSLKQVEQFKSNFENEEVKDFPRRDSPRGGDSSTPKTRYGILGCAAISSKIARAVNLDPHSKVVAVASRDIAKAKRFIDRNCPEGALPCSYKDLVNNKDVDIVYIPLPTALRLPWIIKAIEQVQKKKKKRGSETKIGGGGYTFSKKKKKKKKAKARIM